MLLISTLTVVTIAVLFLLVIVFVFPISMAQTTTTTTATATPESFWTSGAPMPTPRTEVTAAVLGDDIYVIGGFDESGQVTNIVEVYNIANNTWSRAAVPLPEPLHHTAAASYNGKIYVVGGFTAAESPSDRIPTNRLFIYDPIQNNWQEGTPMPTARGALNVNFVNETLYAIGGDSDGPLGSNEAYDPSTDTWTSKAAMPTARHHAGSAVVDGKIFVIGGRITGSSDNLYVNEAYDPEQDRWKANLEAMPSERSGIAAASSINGSNIYVFGGEEPSRTFNNNERYDARTNEWTSERPMQLARHGLAAVYTEEDDDKIYVIGGGPHPGLTVSSANEIFHIR